MLSRLAQQAAKRALPTRTVNFASFSTAELIPGYGKGKTSTGIVRLCSPDCNPFSLSVYMSLRKSISHDISSIFQVGIPYDPNGVENVIVHYQALLDRMAASDLPANAQYRVDVETIANYRIKIARENPDDPDMVEELCQCGQVEELIEQAKDEMEVLDMYLKERLWEHIADVEVDVEYNPDPSADHEGVEEQK
jgi:ETC complex I subunit conserved region